MVVVIIIVLDVKPSYVLYFQLLTQQVLKFWCYFLDYVQFATDAARPRRQLDFPFCCLGGDDLIRSAAPSILFWIHVQAFSLREVMLSGSWQELSTRRKRTILYYFDISFRSNILQS